jgi:uncharacterized membrane protein YhhN
MALYQIFIGLFFIDLILHCLSEFKINGDEHNKFIVTRWITKPLLLIFIIAMYIAGAAVLSWWIVFALVFGCLGDILLMFQYESKYFIAGSMAFLVGHLCYIVNYVQSIGSVSNFPWWRVLLFLPPLLVFFFYAFPKINKKMPANEEKPSMIYGGTLLIMTLMTTIRAPSTSFADPSFYLVWLGATLFVISDAILSVNRFHKKIPYALLYIDIPYALGQFFIGYGLLLTL